MPQRNSPTPDIHLTAINAQHIRAVHGHGSERLVDLNEINVGSEIEVVFGEELGYGDGGADAHYSGGDAGDGGADEFGEDGLVEGEGFGAFHEEDGGRWWGSRQRKDSPLGYRG